MAAFRSMLFAAALAGLLVGLFVTGLQRLGTVPLIQQAEVFETAGAGHAGHDHEHDAAAWAPADGAERTLWTAVANIVTATGFALLLVGAFAVRGGAPGWRSGLLWGLAGFATFVLAPSLGLPPELPGMPAADLGDRQLWWLATVLATAAGLGLIGLVRSPAAAVAGVVLLVAPHLVGAPMPADTASAVPEPLARSFVVAVTVTGLLFWAALGVLSAVLFERFGGGRLAA
ncbi:MAG: CbtA family protein [Geminicoccaceae bacterium]